MASEVRFKEELPKPTRHVGNGTIGNVTQSPGF